LFLTAFGTNYVSIKNYLAQKDTDSIQNFNILNKAIVIFQ